MECPRAWLRRLRYLGPSGLLLLALFHFSSNALVFISSQRDAAEWRYLWGDAGNSRSCSVKNVLVKRQLCVFSGLLFGCTMVPGRLVHSPIVPAPTKHCLNGSMAWGPCREGQFLCLANFSDIQGKCRQLSWPAEAGKSQEWKDLDCDFVSAGQPSATQIEKIEQLSQPDFLRRSQGVAPDDVGELMLVSAAGDPGSPFDSFMMSAALTTKLMLGFVTHHIRIPDFSYYQKPLQLLNFLQRKDVSDSALVWFQDAYDTFMIHPITARNIEGLAAFDPEREVLFNGECSCHGEQTLCSDQQRLFGSRGPWHFLNSGMFLGRASVLKRFLRALSKTILGNEAHWDQAGGDQGAFMEFCFGASSNNAARLGIRCVVDSGAVLMRTMKYCDGVSSLEIPRDLGECSDQEMASRRLLCLMNCNSTNQPAGLHFNGKTQFREAEVEIVKPFILLGIQNADMARARSCVHAYNSGELYQGCIPLSQLGQSPLIEELLHQSRFWERTAPWFDFRLSNTVALQSCKSEFFLTENRQWLHKNFERRKISSDVFDLYMMYNRNRYTVRFWVCDGLLFHSSLNDVGDIGRAQTLIRELKWVLESYHLPDCDFVVHVGDGVPEHAFPLTLPNRSDLAVPVFVQDGWVGMNAIMAPSRSVVGGEDFSRVREAVFKHADHGSVRKAVWRGSTTGGLYGPANWREFPRSKAVLLSLKRPDLLDARFSDLKAQAENPQVVDAMTRNELQGSPISMHEQFQYQAILMIDGNTVPDRFAFQLSGGSSAIIKAASNRVEYWYPDLVPGEHIISVQSDLSDLEQVLESVMVNKSFLASVARKGSDFVIQRLRRENVACYWINLLKDFCSYVEKPVVRSQKSQPAV